MHDLIIIGAGPAGLTAGLYAGRFRMNTLILEKMSKGGQIILSPAIENYPGFPSGIATQELVDRFLRQVQEVGVGITDAEVTAISVHSHKNPPFFEVLTEAEAFQARCIIVASGASPKHLGVKGENEYRGRGVSYCATCDAPFFREKDVCVVGGGDRAIEEAIYLASYARMVYVIHRRKELRASSILVEKAGSMNKIKFYLECVVEEITGSDKVGGVSIRHLATNELNHLSCGGVFMFVGIKPETSFLKNMLELDNDGFVITDQEMASSCQGIFACGDCRKKTLYQVISACSEGASAANSAHKYLLYNK